MSSLLDPAKVLGMLRDLPRDENPYLFLGREIAQQQAQGWHPAYTVILVVCAFAWLVSLASNLYVLISAWRHGNFYLFGRQTCRFGSFVVPHIAVMWALLELLLFTCIQLQIALTLFDGYSGKQHLYSLAVANLTELACLLVACVHMTNMLSGSLVAYAARTEKIRRQGRSPHLAPLFNTFALAYPIIMGGSQVIVTALETIQLSQVLDDVDEMVENLTQKAASWQPGDGLDFDRLATLQPLAAKLQHHLLRFHHYFRAWCGIQIATLCIVLSLVIPASVYQILQFRRQIRQLRTVRHRSLSSLYSSGEAKPSRLQRLVSILLVRYSELQFADKSTVMAMGDSKNDALAHRLLLLEAVCKNVIASTAFFSLGGLLMIPLSVYGIVQLSGTNIPTQSALRIPQVTSVALISILFVTTDLVLLMRARLAHNLPQLHRPDLRQPPPMLSLELAHPKEAHVPGDGQKGYYAELS